jgi:hypothetical protein
MALRSTPTKECSRNRLLGCAAYLFIAGWNVINLAAFYAEYIQCDFTSTLKLVRAVTLVWNSGASQSRNGLST